MRYRTIVAEEAVADKHEIPHFASLCDLMLKYADIEPVTAVECAFHFRTRERFFAEARRVLRPKGRLVLADFIGVDEPRWSQRLAQSIAKSAWGFAPGSFCTPSEYREKLAAAGFVDVSVDIVTPKVIPPRCLSGPL